MKMLFTITGYPPSIGGAQLYAHMLAQKLQNQHTIQVVAFWNNSRHDWLLGTTIKAPSTTTNYVIDGIPVHQIGFNWQEKLQLAPLLPLYYPFMQQVVPRIAKYIQPKLETHAPVDLIHNMRIGREPMSYASFQMARQKNIPFIFTPFHHPRWVGWRYQLYLKLYRMADALITLTTREKEILITLGVAPDKITVTGMGPIIAPQANPEAFKAQYQIKEPMVLFLGQHYLYKGYQQVVKAAQRVWRTIPEAQFVFIGPTPEGAQKFLKENADPRLHALGQVDLQQKTDALAACQILCLPSTQESFGGVYTEAWHFSKPVIGCNIPAVSEVIDDQINGFLVEQEAEEIAEKLLMLLLDPTLAQRFGAAGYEKLQKQYTWETLAAKTEHLYQKITQ